MGMKVKEHVKLNLMRNITERISDFCHIKYTEKAKKVLTIFFLCHRRKINNGCLEHYED